MEDKLILDLCGGSGSWSKPYREAGYRVIVVDPAAVAEGENFLGTLEEFTNWFDFSQPVHGILMAPPCTEYASSGARWWAGKPKHLLQEANQLVQLCLWVKDLCKPAFWVLENPVGRIARENTLGKPRLVFHPCNFGDGYTKKTCLWGEFKQPAMTLGPITHERGWSQIARLPPGPDRARLRSITPPGFAAAFFKANR